jgi:hypothetical protein
MTPTLLDRRSEASWFDEPAAATEEFAAGPQRGQMPLWRRAALGAEDAAFEAGEDSEAAQGAPVALGGASLERILGDVWCDLHTAEAARCLVCGGLMHAAAPGGSEATEGYCGDCGASLS